MIKNIYSYITYLVSAILIYAMLEMPTKLNILLIIFFSLMGIIFILLSKKTYTEYVFKLKSQIYATIVDHVLCIALYVLGIIFIDFNLKEIGIMVMHLSILYYLLRNTVFPGIGTKIFKAFYRGGDKIRFIENLFLLLPVYLFVLIQKKSMDQYYDTLFMISNYILLFNFIDLSFFTLKKSRMRILRYVIFNTLKKG